MTHTHNTKHSHTGIQIPTTPSKHSHTQTSRSGTHKKHIHINTRIRIEIKSNQTASESDTKQVDDRITDMLYVVHREREAKVPGSDASPWDDEAEVMASSAGEPQPPVGVCLKAFTLDHIGIFNFVFTRGTSYNFQLFGGILKSNAKLEYRSGHRVMYFV